MTAPPLADLDRSRDVALDLSGWGRKFAFYQPRNFAFWGYLGLVGIGILNFLSTLAREYNAYGEAIGLAVTSFAIYAALFWWFTDRIDHYAKLPHKLMVIAFLWGGFAATGTMAANANDAILAFYGKTFGQVWALTGVRGWRPRSPKSSRKVPACCCSSHWRSDMSERPSTGSSSARSSVWDSRSSRTSAMR